MKVVAPKDLSTCAAAGNGPVAKGDVLEVDDTLGAQLVAQGWNESKPAPARRRSEEESD